MALAKSQNSRTLAAFGFIALGLLFLIGISRLWPIFVLIPGLGFMAAYHHGDRSTAPLAIPGMLISGTGGLLLFQSITGYWESWSYAWLLYGVFLGIGLTLMGKRAEEESMVKVGRMMTMISGVAFAFFGFFVILVTSSVFRFLLIAAFFVAGGYLLWKESQDKKEHLAPAAKPKNGDVKIKRVEVAEEIHDQEYV